MKNIATKTLLLLAAALTIASTADAQIIKRNKPKKLSVKAQLAIERQRTDSLSSLVEEYRQRESDWQRAWHDENEARKAKPVSERLTVEYSPSQLDSLSALLKQQQVDETFQKFFEEYVCEPQTFVTDTSLDSLYKSRLDALVSPIHLPYNELVRTSIKRYTDGSGLMSRVLSRAQYYFPIIEEELLKAGLPVELRAMAIIESALQAKAYSRAGAAGLWQFMPATAKSYGLEVNSMVDERYDPYKATKAACKYMKALYNMYDDWSLAIAAYNCGPGNVNKALARAGGKPESFWDVYWYLPSETRGYVPAFIAANYAYAYHKAHNITYDEPALPIAVDTIHIDRLMHTKQITSTIDVDSATIAMLNPQYKLNVIPATTKTYTLVLPANRITEFISKQDSIFAKDSTYLKEYLNPAAVQKKMQEMSVIYHRVKSGETLGAIARKYRVTTKQIMTWNRLKNANRISIGQRLRIEKR
ncbi:MAG: LysM peptidoglycan-binding domain-containing protein [Rikenellaceae bacterium]|nr:LysM peptidoglycan-binding domain-containing protein [Rikenellaceae bacterium]MBQ8544038.1 transglycosylase SLT domain-containing protein [Alistipes sp.]MBR3703410.1 transglycosylase SLT domain-containing protein [Alistipes sp.]